MSVYKSIMYAALGIAVTAALNGFDKYQESLGSPSCDVLYGMSHESKQLAAKCCTELDDASKKESNLFLRQDCKPNDELFDCEFPTCVMKSKGFLDDSGLMVPSAYETEIKNQPLSDEIKNGLLSCATMNFTDYGPRPYICEPLKFFYCINYAAMQACHKFAVNTQCDDYKYAKENCGYPIFPLA